MRTPDLEPVKVEGRKRPWRLNVPASMAQDGKRQQLFFETKDDAAHHALTLQFGQKSFGDLIYKLKPHQLAECVKAYELLEPVGVGLLVAVNGFLADHARRTASKSLGEVWSSFLASRKRLSADYLASLAHTKAKVEHLMATPVVDVAADDVEAALTGSAPATRDLRINRLRTVLNHAVKKGWLQSNPADRLDLSGIKKGEVSIYTVDQVTKILGWARANDLEFAPFIVVCCFSGLRPENEAFSIKWADIHLDAPEPHLIVRADTSKTRERRTVDLSTNAVAWLRAVRPKNAAGRVFPFSASTLARKRADLVEKANVTWLKDGFRHTFASAHMAKHGDATKTMLALGQKDLKMIWRHYYRHMTAEEAEKFWVVVPKM